jgi:ribosomal protein S18 acetylase RimI-like enzyme
MAEITPRPENATTDDIVLISRLLAESLFDDPLQRWLFPNTRRRLTTSEQMFRRLVKAKVARGLVRVVRAEGGEVASVAIWTPPNPPAPTHWERRMESLFMRWLHGRRIHEVRDGFTALAGRLPTEPNWYLQILATAAAHRGRGHAGRLLEEKFNECDANHLLLSLQTSSTANVAYYQKHGFQTVDELMLVDGLPVWAMCRSPEA